MNEGLLYWSLQPHLQRRGWKNHRTSGLNEVFLNRSGYTLAFLAAKGVVPKPFSILIEPTLEDRNDLAPSQLIRELNGRPSRHSAARCTVT
jgi:hypothetical protein